MLYYLAQLMIHQVFIRHPLIRGSDTVGVHFTLKQRHSQQEFWLSPKDFYEERANEVPYVPHYEVGIIMPHISILRGCGCPFAVGKKGRPFVPWPYRIPDLDSAKKRAKVWGLCYTLLQFCGVSIEMIEEKLAEGDDKFISFAEWCRVTIIGSSTEPHVVPDQTQQVAPA